MDWLGDQQFTSLVQLDNQIAIFRAKGVRVLLEQLGICRLDPPEEGCHRVDALLADQKHAFAFDHRVRVDETAVISPAQVAAAVRDV